MENGRTKNATLNIFFSIMLQIVTLIRGMILPRIIIPMYGSDVNGLVSSITQFLAYISLLEAGIGSIFRAALYKPLLRREMKEISGIVNELKSFYKKIGIIFIFYVFILCTVYPLIAKTNIGTMYVISLILILSVSTFTEYYVSLPYVSLLNADQKIRISYVVSIVYSLVSLIVSLFWVSLKADIRMIYISMCIIGLARPLFYTIYVKKHYNLDPKVKPNKKAITQKWNGMVHHFAYYVHTNTDTAILTLFVSTSMVSVYNVYASIIMGIERLITSISVGCAAGIGNLLASEDKEKIKSVVDLFEFVQCSITTFFYTVAGILLMSFIKVYTENMNDINYIQPIFGYCLIFAEAIYCFRCVYSTISLNANKFKETQTGALLECMTNLLVSLFLVIFAKLGIVGVAIGTIIGMFIRYLFDIIFLSKNVIYRSIKKPLKMLILCLIISITSIYSCNYLFRYENITTISNWIYYAIPTSIVVSVVSIVINFIFYREIFKSVIGRITSKMKH